MTYETLCDYLIAHRRGGGKIQKGKGPEHPKTRIERVGYSNRVGPNLGKYTTCSRFRLKFFVRGTTTTSLTIPNVEDSFS